MKNKIAAFTLTLCTSTFAQTPGELWDMNIKMEMPGFAMPATNVQSCLPKGQMTEKSVQTGPRSNDCKMSDFKTNGNKTSFTMECKEATATGEIISDGKSFEQTMKMKMKAGPVTDMTMHSTGKNTGKACDAGALQKKVEALTQQSNAGIAKVCNEGATQMNQLMLYKSLTAAEASKQYGTTVNQDIPATCANYKAAYCSSTQRTLASMSDAATFMKNAQSGVALDQQTWAQAADFCGGTKPAAVLAQACASGVKNKVWDMLTNYCKPEADALAKTHCVGRDYSSIDPDYGGLCASYRSQLSQDNNPSESSGKSSAKQAPAKKAAAESAPVAPNLPNIPAVDAVKEGTKALRGLFGF